MDVNPYLIIHARCFGQSFMSGQILLCMLIHCHEGCANNCDIQVNPLQFRALRSWHSAVIFDWQRSKWQQHLEALGLN